MTGESIPGTITCKQIRMKARQSRMVELAHHERNGTHQTTVLLVPSIKSRVDRVRKFGDRLASAHPARLHFSYYSLAGRTSDAGVGEWLSGPLLGDFAFSTRRSILRAAFCCCFSFLAQAFCRFLNVSIHSPKRNFHRTCLANFRSSIILSTRTSGTVVKCAASSLSVPCSTARDRTSFLVGPRLCPRNGLTIR